MLFLITVTLNFLTEINVSVEPWHLAQITTVPKYNLTELAAWL